jgi:PAS domain S-box-containing protein
MILPLRWLVATPIRGVHSLYIKDDTFPGSRRTVSTRNQSMATGLQTLLQNTIDLSQELLLEAHLDGTLREVSPSWTSLLGWSGSDLRGKTLHDLVHPDDLENTHEALRRAGESGTFYVFEARCRAKDGSYRWVSWKAISRVNVVHAAGHDITAMKNAIAALHASNEGSPATGAVAHDLNNLMQNIIGALELVRKMIGAGRFGETERFVVSAIGSAHRAAELNKQHFAALLAREGKTADDRQG